MPKRIRTRSAVGLFNYAKQSGHIQPSITPIVNAVIEYTTTAIINEITNDTQTEPEIPPGISNINSSIIQQINITQTTIETNIDTFKETYVEVSTIPNIPDYEIKKYITNLYFHIYQLELINCLLLANFNA